MKTYQARYKNSKRDIKTKWYFRRNAALDMLMKRIGSFSYLGTVSGDTISSDVGYCTAAPRNGGLVSISEREV